MLENPPGRAHPRRLQGIHGLFLPHSHLAADSVDNELKASAHGIKAVKISLMLLGATAALQFTVVMISGSVALLADTIHNLADAVTAIPLWAAFVVARRPASRRYTYGYGRVEDLAGLFIVAMIGCPRCSLRSSPSAGSSNLSLSPTLAGS